MIFDSNIWIAHLDESDSTSKQADVLFRKHTGSRVTVPDFVIAEVVSVLKVKKQSERASVFLDFVENNADVSILLTGFYFKDFVQAQHSYQNTKLSFNDIALVVLAKQYEILTFDKELQKVLRKL